MQFTITEPVFKTEPLFVIGEPWDQFNRMLKRRFHCAGGENPEECAGLLGTMLTYDRAPWRVVWARDADVVVVLHEVFHLVTRICYDRGIAIVAQTAHGVGDEPAAYLFEFFARNVLSRMGVRHGVREAQVSGESIRSRRRSRR